MPTLSNIILAGMICFFTFVVWPRIQERRLVQRVKLAREADRKEFRIKVTDGEFSDKGRFLKGEWI